MAQQFNNVHDIIDDYEWFWLPIIKRELAECKNEDDYVYGKLLKYKGKQISRNGMFERDFDAKKETLSAQDYYDMSSAEYNAIYKILHSDIDISFSSPNPHQRRCVGKFGDVVNALRPLKIQEWQFNNFEHLYDAVKKIYESNGHPSAILAIYDTTLRIGYNHSPQILPEQYVYLYGTSKTGPLGGATRLYGQKWINLHFDKSNHRIETRWFHDKFPNLPSWEIESILCIYASRF